GQEADLRLPEAGVDDLPGRQEQQGQVAVAIHLPREINSCALGDADGDRCRGRVGLVPGHGHGSQPFTSKTLLNGVLATVRNWVKPAAVVMSRIFAGPAWVPRAVPTSWARDVGV